MPFKSTKIERVLMSKFGFEECPGRHSHRFLELQLEGLPTVRTMVSHGVDEPRAILQGKIARQLGVPSSMFEDMINCPVSRDDYISYLKTHPPVPTNRRC